MGLGIGRDDDGDDDGGGGGGDDDDDASLSQEERKMRRSTCKWKVYERKNRRFASEEGERKEDRRAWQLRRQASKKAS